MKTTKLFLFFALCGLFVIPGVVAKKKDVTENEEATNDDTTSVEEAAEYGDEPIEENPDYVEPGEEAEDDDEDESDIDEDDDDEEVEVSDVKRKIESVLQTSKQHYDKSLKTIRKNRAKITLALALFAFRREIQKALIHVVTNEVIDPKTGKLRVSPTSMLKFILFVDFMRRLQSGRNASQPSFQALAVLGQSNPIMGILFSRILRVPMFNPAFIPPISQHYTFERINERYVKDGMALHKAIHSKHHGFRWPTSEPAITSSMMSSTRLPSAPASNETVVVLDMTNLDTSVTTLDQIRDQVSFLLSQYRIAAMSQADINATEPSEPLALEVVILLESPGGSAADYGLAAEQLLRLRQETSIQLTICVDKVAASGGYMMACTASPGQLLAAPFAVVGSIGVIGQLINVQKLLEGWGLSPLVFRGGRDKAPLGLIGEVTQDGKAKTQSMIDAVHEAFKQHVVDARPVLKRSINKVGNGDVYIGVDAVKNNLVDKLTTSDEYISTKVAEGARVLKLVKNRRARFPFAANFDNYDTTLSAARHPFSIGTLLARACSSATSFLGASDTNAMRQAVSVVQSTKFQA